MHLPHLHHSRESDTGTNGSRLASFAENIQVEIRAALHEWRRHPPRQFELVDPVDVTHDHIRGDAAAPVVVVEYGCLGSRSESIEDRALRSRLGEWIDRREACVVFRHFPLIDSHPGAWIGALAVEAADRQGRFWELYDALSDLQSSAWSTDLTLNHVNAMVRKTELDLARLHADMQDPSIVTKIVGDLNGGVRSGVNGAPTFYVQGFRQDIDETEELALRIESALRGDTAALWPPVHGAAAPVIAEPLMRRRRVADDSALVAD